MLPPKNGVMEMRFTVLLEIDENQTKYVNQLFSRQWSGKNCDPWLVWKKWGVHRDCLSFTPWEDFQASIQRKLMQSLNIHWGDENRVSQVWKPEYNTGRGCTEREFQRSTQSSSQAFNPVLMLYICVKELFETGKRNT